MNIERSTINQAVLNEQERRHLLVLPYTGIKEEKILINEFYLITLKYALHILELNLVEGSS